MTSEGQARFELLRQVGAGAFGAVHEAIDRLTGERVALKVLSAERYSDLRFVREAALLQELRHPSIVRYVSHGRDELGASYLAMEWLEGETLEARLQRGALTPADVVVLARRVVAGLTEAARRAIMHRDIKPANLFLVGGRVAEAKILDFGLARHVDDANALTRTGLAIGTPLYMSPEQAHGESDIDARSDVFSLGSVLYECIVGSTPFAGPNALATLAKICLFEPAAIQTLRPRVPHELAALVTRMLSKERSARPSYSEIERSLQLAEQALQGESLATPLRSAHQGPSSLRAARSSARSSLHPREEQRVLCALFVGAAVDGREAAEHDLAAVHTRYHARSHRLLDGSRVILLDLQQSPSEQIVAAALCALELRTLAPSSAIAVCTGRAVVTDTVPVGELLERSALLLACTSPGVVQVDDASAALLEARFELDGQEGSRTLERERRGGEAPRTLLGRITPFVGRDRELAQLEMTLNECVDDSVARAVLVTAPAGAGKSRLRYELSQRLKRRSEPLTMLVGRGDALRVHAHFGLIGSAIRWWAGFTATDTVEQQRRRLELRVQGCAPVKQARTMAGFLGELIGLSFDSGYSTEVEAARQAPQLMAERLQSTWLDWLGCLLDTGPVLFMLEDLHWSDAGSVRLLEAALRNLAARPFLVLAFARPEVHERFPRLWEERDLIEVRLPKLSPKAFERLLDVVGPELTPELRGWLGERAEGNPLFLEELVRGLKARSGARSLPDTVLGFVQARLDALGEAAKLLLRAASVFGELFRVDGVRALLGAEADRLDLPGWLRLLCEREVVFPRGEPEAGEYLFRHALLRDAAYALLPDQERTLGHRLAGEWLEQQGGTDAVVLAEHFEKGEALARAAAWYRTATLRAFEAGSMREATRSGERAVACGLDGLGLGEVTAVMAEASSCMEENPSAQSWALIARDNAPVAHPAWWRAQQVVAITYMRQGSGAAAESVVSELLSLCVDSEWIPAQARALAWIAYNAIVVGDPALGRRALEMLPAPLPACIGDHTRAAILLAQATACIRDDLARSLRCAREAIELFRQAGDQLFSSFALNVASCVLCELGCYEEAEQLAKAELEVLRRLAPEDAGGLEALGFATLRQGRIREALTTLRDTIGFYASRRSLHGECLARVYAAMALTELGELEAAAEELNGCESTPSIDNSGRALALAARGDLALRRGDRTVALEAATACHEVLSRHQISEHAGWVRLKCAEALMTCDRSEAGRALLADAHAQLMAQAARIDEPHLRESFLHNVPEHARIQLLARELGIAAGY